MLNFSKPFMELKKTEETGGLSLISNSFVKKNKKTSTSNKNLNLRTSFTCHSCLSG